MTGVQRDNSVDDTTRIASFSSYKFSFLFSSKDNPGILQEKESWAVERRGVAVCSVGITCIMLYDCISAYLTNWVGKEGGYVSTSRIRLQENFNTDRIISTRGMTRPRKWHALRKFRERARSDIDSPPKMILEPILWIIRQIRRIATPRRTKNYKSLLPIRTSNSRSRLSL